MPETRRPLFPCFYWIGVTMAIACVALVIVDDTESVYRFEHAHFPLLWLLAVSR